MQICKIHNASANDKIKLIAKVFENSIKSPGEYYNAAVQFQIFWSTSSPE